MNTGVISSRYAKALLMLVQKTGNGERVFDQARALLRLSSEHSGNSALPASLEPELLQLVWLMQRRGRADHLKFTLAHFVRLWCRESGLHLVHLRSAVPSAELEKRIASAVEAQFGGHVIMESSTDPDLLGGFVYDVDDYMMDASVRGQIERIRRQFVEKNNRIV